MINRGLTVVDYLEWRAVREVLPISWKNIICADVNVETLDIQFLSSLEKLSSKYIYKMLIEDSSEANVAEVFYQNMLDLVIEDWEDYYRIPYECTIETRARAFQFKIIHNIYYTNAKLFRIGKAESSLCSFCNLQTETMVHLFVDFHAGPFG